MDNFGDFKLVEILRQIPQRRTVYLANEDKDTFILKVFNFKNEYLNELNGSLLLQSSNVLTPKILKFGKQNKKYFIVYEYIKNSINLEEYLNSSQKSLKENIINKIYNINKILYQSNIIQKDNYLKNYLISKNKIYIIDGGMVRKIKFFTNLRKLINFALLQSKIDPTLLFSKHDLFKSSIAVILQEYFRHYFLNKGIHHYFKKTLRTSSEFFKESSSSKLILKRRNFYFKFDDIDNFLMKSEILKNGNTCTVFHNKDLIIKRYNIKNMLHFLAQQIKKPRGLNSWQVANVLKLLNIPTATPYFYYEKRFLFFRLESYYAMSYEESENIKDFESRLITKESRRNFSEKLIRLFKILKFYRFIHGDLKYTNILVNKKNDNIFLIDFDKSFFSKYQYIYNHKIQKQLNRFYSNWKPSSDLVATLKKMENKI